MTREEEPMTSHIQPEETWEERFEKEFPESEYVLHHRGVVCFGDALVRWHIKKLISQAIAEVVEAEELKYLRRFEQKADEVRNKAILEGRRRIVSRIEEEKSKGYEANTILEGLIAELKIGSLINQKNVLAEGKDAESYFKSL